MRDAAGALPDFASEHGERGLRALEGRRVAQRLLGQQGPALDSHALVSALERRAGEGLRRWRETWGPCSVLSSSRRAGRSAWRGEPRHCPAFGQIAFAISHRLRACSSAEAPLRIVAAAYPGVINR